MLYIQPNHPDVAKVCHAAFPDYTGRKVKIEYTDRPLDLRSYWDEGSRNYYAIVRLADCQVMSVPEQSMNDRQIAGVDTFVLPAGYVVVAHVIFCGRDLGLTITCRTDAQKMLPTDEVDNLTDDEKLVLIATVSRKSSYAGVSDYRAHELMRKYHLSQTRIDTARESLRDKKMLTATNAITIAGRNVVENDSRRWTF